MIISAKFDSVRTINDFFILNRGGNWSFIATLGWKIMIILRIILNLNVFPGSRCRFAIFCQGTRLYSSLSTFVSSILKGLNLYKGSLLGWKSWVWNSEFQLWLFLKINITQPYLQTMYVWRTYYITYQRNWMFPMYYINCALDRNRLVVIWDSN